MEEYPSGQRGQTVNLLALPSMVRIHPPPPRRSKRHIACSDFLSKSERAHSAAPPFKPQTLCWFAVCWGTVERMSFRFCCAEVCSKHSAQRNGRIHPCSVKEMCLRHIFSVGRSGCAARKGQSYFQRAKPFETLSSFQKKRKGRFRLRASYFLLLQKVTKNRFRGENTDSTSGAEGRALAHSIFPLKTPGVYGGAIKKCSVLFPARGKPTREAANSRCRSNGACYSWFGHRMAPA
jgi:hypothetical protein